MSGSAVCVGLDKAARQAGGIVLSGHDSYVDPEKQLSPDKPGPILLRRAYYLLPAGEPNYYGNRPAQDSGPAAEYLPGMPNDWSRPSGTVKRLPASLSAAAIPVWEVAANLWRQVRTCGMTQTHCARRGFRGLLRPPSRWMKEYTLANLRRLDHHPHGKLHPDRNRRSLAG